MRARLIVCEASERHYWLWIAYGTFSSFGTLSYAVASGGFPPALSGRVNTLCNLMCFIGAFAFQWGMGLLIDALLARGYAPASAHRQAFIVLLALQAVAWLWMVFAGRPGARCGQP